MPERLQPSGFLQLTDIEKRINFYAAGLVLEPLPTGAWAFLAITTAIFTKVLTFPQAFGAFTNDVIWLIVVSFFFAAVSQLTSNSRTSSSHLREKMQPAYLCLTLE